ncbi:MAG: glutamate synthase-related protein, partial [Spirochaetia bacterium]|nr:glutamate synthase-related protein [Spirochaetia bacterium]
SSIHNAGTSWELGLSETHQTLVANGLRDRVVIATDGKMLTGRDVVIAALLGAEEFGFSTSSLVTLGCIMMRKCHLNTCPVGVATQNKDLRKKFMGDPQYLVNYMKFIARETREYMAMLGFRTVNEMVGQIERITPIRPMEHWKARGLDFSLLLTRAMPALPTEQYCIRKQDHAVKTQMDIKLIELAEAALSNKEKVKIELPVKNTDRTVGAMLGGEVARLYGEEGLPEDTISIFLKGTAGQSFGAFITKGITIHLEGMANDYIGKGISGGRLIVQTPGEADYDASENIIAGNTCLYGGTSGEVYVNGLAGERFAVRNSGVLAVVEGVGDHGCEYMTGGSVVVLGKTGRNFAAGMSGGIAYVWDVTNEFRLNVNVEMVDLEDLTEAEDIDIVLHLVTRHHEYTKSKRAKMILDNWETEKAKFIKVIPGDYKIAMKKMQEEKSMEVEEAEAVHG